MPLLDITNPKVISFLLENYEKENKSRVRWISKHQDKINDAATLKREPKNHFETDIYAHTMIGGLAAITRDNVEAGYNRRKIPIRDGVFIPGTKHLQHGYSIPSVGLGDPEQDPRLGRPDSSLDPDPVMRPVDPELSKLIYHHIPSREVYLHERSKISPENRYYFSECVGWDYGWRLKDSKMKNNRQYARCALLKRSLKNRTGPQPDPPHYIYPEAPGPSFFFT